MDIPTSIASTFLLNALGVLGIFITVLVLRYLIFRPAHPFVFTENQKTFAPSEEADESWVPV